MAVDDSAEQQASGGAAAATSASPRKQQQQQQSKGSRWETDEVEDQQQQQASRDAHGRSIAAAPAADAVHSGTDAAAAAVIGDGVDGSSSKPATKKLKLSVELGLDDAELQIDHEALLAGVNQALEQLDSDEQQQGKDAAETAAGDVVRGGRGKAGGGGGASSMSLGGSYNSGGGGMSGGGANKGILKTCSTPGSKKKVRWPDALPQDEEEEQAAGFSIARTPRQVRRSRCSKSVQVTEVGLLLCCCCLHYTLLASYVCLDRHAHGTSR
jgi:hypothetical protein